MAQAYHWLNHRTFYEEATRVGKNGAVVAIWMYDLLRSNESSINELIDFFYKEIVGPYWDKERKHIDDHYSQLPFPFEPLPSRDFQINTSFTKGQLKGYLSTWSAVQHFIKRKGVSPLEKIESSLNNSWKDNESKPFTFPVYLKIGRIIK